MEIDLSQARRTVAELSEMLEALDGTEVDDAPTRAARRQHARITRELLYLSHLGARASTEIMGTYHDFKFRHDPVGE
ncbi:hypothetical protein [Streptomyces boninensis]|uniref:hypothetical protein n=1 Tax=Streptomyces boninensis TaxID=2039455 RepID=UPI003B2255B6